MREQAAALETVEREAKDGDFAVLDFVGTVDGEPFEAARRAATCSSSAPTA